MDLNLNPIYLSDLETAASSAVGLERLKNSSVLITGATGTIGSFITDTLLHYNDTNNANITVYASGRSLKRLNDRFGSRKTDLLRLVEYDITSAPDFDFQPDCIIHAAGNAYPAAFANDPVGTIMGNVNGTYALLDFAVKSGTKRFLYVSSGEVYGCGDVSLDEFCEDYAGFVDPTSPRSCYPNSKRVAETLCASFYKQFGLETVIVRPCHTYGPVITEHDNRANVQFFYNVLNNEDITLNSRGEQMRSYAYVADCASATLTVLVCGAPGEAYNAANPLARTTIAGFAKAVAAAAGKNVVFKLPDAVALAQRSPVAKQVLGSKKLEQLGWNGRYSVDEGVKNTLEILKRCKNG